MIRFLGRVVTKTASFFAKGAIRLVLRIVFFILALFIAAVFIYKIFISGRSIPIPGMKSIFEYTDVNVGGSIQSILVRGKDSDNPILLYIEGDPGITQTSYIVPYQSEWEKNFTVVNWDLRGCARSYREDLDINSLNTVQLINDGEEMITYLMDRFNEKKIYVMGQSYGSYIAMNLVSRMPDCIYAYIGTGQVTNTVENLKAGLEFALSTANENDNKIAVKELTALGSLPFSEDECVKKSDVIYRWVTYYGGNIYGSKTKTWQYIKGFFRPEYSLSDCINFFKGKKLYEKNLTCIKELYRADLFKEIISIDVPAYFIQGRCDKVTNCDLCEKYVNALSAPSKKLFIVENAGHNVVYEQQDEVSTVLKQVLNDTFR